MMILEALFMLVVCYGLGSIPFGWLLTKAAGLGDIRHQGSGNIGATNVLRTGRKGLALLTLTLDAAKGALAMGIVTAWVQRSAVLPAQQGLALLYAGTMFAVVLGHVTSFWLKGRGGKGVATLLGVMMVVAPSLAALCVGVWTIVVALSRISSLGALAAALAMPCGAVALGYASPRAWYVWLGLSGLIIVTHRHNILRLWRRTEPRIGEERKP